jgi:cytidylate kinase
MDKLDDFMAVLDAAGIDLAVDELRDALWLSTHIAVAGSDESDRDSAPAPQPTPTPKTAPTAAQSAAEPSRGAEPQSSVTATEMYAAGGASAGTIRGMAARSPAVAALPHKAALGRALRPLRLTRPSTSQFEVDEYATAEQIATEDLWIPVLRPAAEKWLDLTLVVDTSPSMVIWGQTLTELRTLAERLGAFRRIKVVDIDTQALHDAQAADCRRAGTATQLERVIDAAHRQAVLLITDGIGAAWRDGLIQPYIEQWAQVSSVAIATVLPRRMWDGAGLRVTAGQVGSLRPAAPNSQWAAKDGSPVPIPVLGLSERWLKTWAMIVAGAATRNTALLAPPRPTSPRRRHAKAPTTSAELVDSFRLTASPTAFRLACYLSGAWLSLPVMRMVQQLMLPESDTSHLAEVFLSGVLHRVDTDRRDDPEFAQYDFKTGVRDQLNNYLQRHELLTVVQRSTEFVADRIGQSFNFAALLADPAGAELPAVMGDATVGTPLAYVTASVLAKLGGRYQSLAARLAEAPILAQSLASGSVENTEPPSSSALQQSSPAESAASLTTVEGYVLSVTGARGEDPATQASVETDAVRFVRALWPAFDCATLVQPRPLEVERQLAALAETVPAHGVLVVYWAGEMALSGRTLEFEMTSSELDPRYSVSLDKLVAACARTQASQVLIILDGYAGNIQRVSSSIKGYNNFGILALPGSSLPSPSTFFREVLDRAVRGWPTAGEALTSLEFFKWIADGRSKGRPDGAFIWTGDSVAPALIKPPFDLAAKDIAQYGKSVEANVAELMAKGMYTIASVLTDSIDEVADRDRVRAKLARAIAQFADATHFPDAVSEAGRIEEDTLRVRTLVALAEDGMRSGNRWFAESIVEDLETWTASVPEQDREHVLAEIAALRRWVTDGADVEAVLAGRRVLITFCKHERSTAIPLETILAGAGADVVRDVDYTWERPHQWTPKWLERELGLADVIVVVIPRESTPGTPLFDAELDMIRTRGFGRQVFPVVERGRPHESYRLLIESFADNPTLRLDGISEVSVRPLVTAIAKFAGGTSPAQRVIDHCNSLVEQGLLVEALIAVSTTIDELAERQSDPERADLAVLMGMRSGLLNRIGRPEEAVAVAEDVSHVYWEIFQERKRVLGADHPDTLEAHNSFANWRGEAGHPVEAVTEFEGQLANSLRVLGPDHPDTLLTRESLASWRSVAGDAAAAMSELEGLLADRVRVLGPDHPDTLRTRENLADSRGAGGDFVGAVSELEGLLADRVRVLGPDHLDTLRTRENLAGWRYGAEGPSAGVTELELLVADRLRIQGPDHLDTLRAREDLAAWRGDTGDVTIAVTGLEDLLADRNRIQGPTHLHALHARESLAHWRSVSGDFIGAVSELEGLLADRLRVQGSDHLDTLRVRDTLGYTHGQAGDPATAVTELERLLDDRARIQGPEHSDIARTQNSLDVWRRQMGAPVDAATAPGGAKPTRPVVIAVDGPVGSKTSSVSRGLARELGARYLDGEAMYRAVTLAVLRAGIDLTDARAIATRADAAQVGVGAGPNEGHIYLGAEDVSDEIRGDEVTRAVSAVSAVPAVRTRLVRIQRELAADARIVVVAGGDVGTGVVPDADVKVFLTASAEVRARRRNDQNIADGLADDFKAVLADVRRRDHPAATDALSPLRAADDALVVDTSDMTESQTIAHLLYVTKARMRPGQ